MIGSWNLVSNGLNPSFNHRQVSRELRYPDTVVECSLYWFTDSDICLPKWLDVLRNLHQGL